MTKIEQRLSDILDKWNLLDHPFYRAWSEGTLPDDHLKLYASEYASFIGMVAKGWEACGDNEIAEIEVEHYDLWKDFAKSLGNADVNTSIDEVNTLVANCDKEYRSYPTALGALYAFERQQPATAQSKLAGLKTHYNHINADETYFEVHVDDEEEPAILLKNMEALSFEEQDKAVQACENIAENLYYALTGIMNRADAMAEA